jgi:hypothetical protein
MKLQASLFVVLSLTLLAHGPAAEPTVADTRLRDKLIADLIKRLDSEKFEERQQATDLLRSIGKPTVEPLRQFLATNPNLETATRVRTLLRVLTKDNAGRELRERLDKPIDLLDGIPPNTTLKDALDYLHAEHGLPVYYVNSEAFKQIAIANPEEQAVRLAPVKGTKLGTVMRHILEQIRGDVHTGTFVVHDGSVEITTTYHAQPRNWRGVARSFAPLVSVELDGESLEEAIQELQDQSGINVVLDSRATDKARKPVKLHLHRVPVDTAVRLLADMFELKPVAMDNVLYVTTLKNAQVLEAEIKERERDQPSLDGNPAAATAEEPAKGESKKP